MNAQEWWEQFESQIPKEDANNFGWEWLFARYVLLPLYPDTLSDLAIVQPQYRVELEGDHKSFRMVDFAIIDTHFKIAIEVDGRDKVQAQFASKQINNQTYRQFFEDTTRRERLLAVAGWRIVRFANTEFGRYDANRRIIGSVPSGVLDCLEHLRLVISNSRVRASIGTSEVAREYDSILRDLYRGEILDTSIESVEQMTSADLTARSVEKRVAELLLRAGAAEQRAAVGEAHIRDTRKSRRLLLVLIGLLSFAFLSLGAFVLLSSNPESSDAVCDFATDSRPIIKGNISEEGERIYHTPGQRFYDVTTIDAATRERLFCTEADAVGAGWRKAES